MRAYILTGTAMLAGAMVFGSFAFAGPDHDDDHDHKSENTVTETYSYKDFNHISIGGVYEVEIEVGKTYAISLSGNEDDMENVKVREEDGTLYLGRKDKNYNHKGRHSHGITAVVSLPDLEGLKVSGVASGDVDNVDATDFDLRVSGVAEVNINGTCESLTARVSGVGELDARDFKCEDVNVTLSGVGEVSVYASESVDVKASGVGEVNVYGKPQKVAKKKAMFTQVKIK